MPQLCSAIGLSADDKSGSTVSLHAFSRVRVSSLACSVPTVWLQELTSCYDLCPSGH